MPARLGPAAVLGAAVLFAGPGTAAHAATPTFEAYFTSWSYSVDTPATLEISAPRGSLTVRLYRAGPEKTATHSASVMRGVAVDSARAVAWRGGSFRPLRVDVGYWPSGLYFAKITHGSRVAFAPFVVRQSPFEHSRVAVVLPTNTWQAYNLRDDNGDGTPDSWYASDTVTSVLLHRPFLNRGVPPRFRGYDLGFVRWLAHTGRNPDFFSDEDLERFRSGASLAAAYDLIVFSGHEEYVTPHAYDLIRAFRDAGGNLMFLSADNFFYRVIRGDGRITRSGRWRDLGQPEASLVGAEYVNWYQGIYPNRPYTVTGYDNAPWLFAGSGLHDGSKFGNYGIEIDARAPESPAGTRVLASIPDIFGPGQTAEMTYYSLANGAKVFDAGVINFGGTANLPPVKQLVSNLWNRLSLP
ncbi:MAG: N,N-dimethylformamidase beta subunit family domain-containing protein [Gaiellaceae bacterium]